MVDGATTWQIADARHHPAGQAGTCGDCRSSPGSLPGTSILFAATLTSVHARTITTGLAEFVTVTGTNWGQLAATAMLTLIPAIVFLGLVQRHIVAGLTFGAVKG